jgi:hypothetical protein
VNLFLVRFDESKVAAWTSLSVREKAILKKSGIGQKNPHFKWIGPFDRRAPQGSAGSEEGVFPMLSG